MNINELESIYFKRWNDLENLLCGIAEQDHNDERVEKAMSMLRVNFDGSYHFCPELDYAVVTTNQCKEFSYCHENYLAFKESLKNKES